MLSPTMTLCRRFATSDKGNAALMFGLMIIPFLGILGFAADYGLALSDKSKLDGAADAAALAAVKAAQYIIQNQGGTRAAAISAGNAQAASAFAANAGTLSFATPPTPTVTWTAGQSSGQTLTMKLTYTMTMTNAFSKIIGVPTTKVGGTSIATVTMPSYINYYIITDISQSMGVGATAADMTNLYNRIIQFKNYDNQSDSNAGIGCVFGCHVKSTQGFNQIDTNENIAHNTAKYGQPYINLRIDSAKTAIQAILTDAISASQQANANTVKIGVYAMQQDPTTSNLYIQTIVDPPNGNFSTTGATVTAQMDLGNNSGGGIGDTSFSNSLDYFTSNILTAQGDGSSASSPLNYVFLVTDGLSDVPGSCPSGHCTGPLNDALCTQIKSKSTVGVIYTTYNPILANQNNSSQGFNANYNNLVAPYINSIPTNLQACASSQSYYFQASDGPGITTGMKLLFQSAAQSTRLSQ